MALIRDLSAAQIAFQIEGGDVDQFSVLRYRGTEGLCRLYRFEIELTTDEEQVCFDDIVGKPAVLSVNTASGSRWFHGIISRFELTGHSEVQQLFRAELVPAVWLLTHRYNSRIFQKKTVVEIITAVLTQAGIASDRFRLSGLEGSYQSRDYCVQYRETDYNFICRLMEGEGIFWYFEQSAEGHILVAADSKNYPAIEGEPALPYAQPSGLNAEVENVYRFRLGQSVRPGAVVLNDFNFENPSLNLEGKADAGRDSGLEFSDYPGVYTEQSAGGNIAKLRTEEFEAGRTIGVGQTNSYRLSPGHTFDLTEHPSGSMNVSYLVTSVTHEGKQSAGRGSTGSNGRSRVLSARAHQSLIAARQSNDSTIRELADALLQVASRVGVGDPSARRELTDWLYHAGQVTRDLPSVAGASGGSPLEILSIPNLLDDVAQFALADFDAAEYECRFECAPAEIAYRPPRITPWPVMRGSQTALVTGPSGEEIYTDQYGRVKVKFNWDREGQHDEHSSCWIRVSQGTAGGQYGMMFLPRIGQEVIVDFLEGDPDKPIVTGRVYNADQMPPYKLPDEKTKSVIKTQSTKGGGGTNEIRFEDLKDSEQILIHAEKDLHLRVKCNRVENIGNDHHLTVEKNKFELVKECKNSEVELDFQEAIAGNKSLSVAGNVGEEFSGNHSMEVGGNSYIKVGGNLVIEAGAALTLKVGGNFVKIDASGVTVVGTMIKLNSGGAAGSGSAVSLAEPEATVGADNVEPGADVTYSGSGAIVAGEAGADGAGHEFEPEEVEAREWTWIDVKLCDDQGNPVPYERCEITGPDGKVIRRSLNKDGTVHVGGLEKGDYAISFPDIDLQGWERA